MGRRVSTTDLSRFLQSFAHMESAGIDVARALVAIAQQSRPGPLRRALVRARQEIAGGATLADALRTARVIEAAELSSKTGRAVKVVSTPATPVPDLGD